MVNSKSIYFMKYWYQSMRNPDNIHQVNISGRIEMSNHISTMQLIKISSIKKFGGYKISRMSRPSNGPT